MMDKKQKEFEDKFLGLDEAVSETPKVAIKPAKLKAKKASQPSKVKNNKNVFQRASIGVGIFLIIFLVMLLAAGILRLPLLSQLLYRLSLPSRVVSEIVPGEVDKTKNGVNFDKESGVLSLKISEEYVSYFLRQTQLKSADPMFDQDVQVIIENGQVEFYGTMLRPVKTELTLRFKPNIDSGVTLTKFFKVTKFKVGNLRLPSFVAELFLKEYIESRLKTLTSALGTTGSLITANPTVGVRDIKPENGYIVVDIYFDLARIQENMKQLPQLIEEIQKRYPIIQVQPVQP